MLLCIAHVIGWCIFVLRNDFNEGVGRHYSRFSPQNLSKRQYGVDLATCKRTQLEGSAL